VLWTTAVACVGVAALAVATGGWLLGVGPAGLLPRVLAGAAGLLLLYLDPATAVVGLVLLAAAVAATVFTRRRGAESESEASMGRSQA
jgi:TRAP-type uncharacterized transport system fused permease subunit